MKNIKELQAILTSILVLSCADKSGNKEIIELCEYAFQQCLEAPTTLLRASIAHETYAEAREQVNDLLRKETKFKKIMGKEL